MGARHHGCRHRILFRVSLRTVHHQGNRTVFAGEATFSHTYRVQGDYIMRVAVTDDDGGVDTITAMISAAGTNNHAVTILEPSAGAGNQYFTALDQLTLTGTRMNGTGDVFWINNRTMQSGFVPLAADTFTIQNIGLVPGLNSIHVQSDKGDGTCATDEINVSCVPAGFTGPQITNIGVSKTALKQYERTDVTFSLKSVADNLFFPYDTMMPGNLNTGTGTWSSTIIARDASGTTEVAGPSFIVINDTINNGYLKVSPTDNRYFEYDNGKPFVAMGYNTSVSTPDQVDGEIQNWKSNNLTFGRFWLSGVSPFSDSWSSWATHHPMTSNGYMPPPLLTFNQKFGSGDFSLRIAAPAIDNINTPAIFRGFWDGKTYVKPLHQYRVIARVKTINVAGNGGLVLKSGGWLGTDVVNPGVGTVLSPYLRGDNNWSYLIGTIATAAGQSYLDNLYLALEDCTGEAFLDQMTIQEVNNDGSLKDNILSKWNANSHYYLDPIRSKEADYMIDTAGKSDICYKIVIHEKNDYICNHLDRAGFVTGNRFL